MYYYFSPCNLDLVFNFSVLKYIRALMTPKIATTKLMTAINTAAQTGRPLFPEVGLPRLDPVSEGEDPGLALVSEGEDAEFDPCFIALKSPPTTQT